MRKILQFEKKVVILHRFFSQDNGNIRLQKTFMIYLRERNMKNILIIMLTFLCSTTISAQRNNKVEAKAKSYAEKYERVGNELTISFVVDNISMSRKEIYSAFPDLLDRQFKIREDDIEERDPLGNSMKCSTLLKVTDAANATIKSDIEMKLSAKDGKARISVKTNGYSYYHGSSVNAEESVCSRPPFVEIDSSTDKGEKITEFYCDAFLHLDKQIESIIEDFTSYWKKYRN